MRVTKSYTSLVCADCDKLIPAGTPHAVKQVPSKNILFAPAGEIIFKEVSICLSHVYKSAESKRVKQFSLFRG